MDGLASANSSLYGSSGTTPDNGCTLPTVPVIMGASWTKTNYTTCTTYNEDNGQAFEALPASATNAFGQITKYGYDYTQGELPISLTDALGSVIATFSNVVGSAAVLANQVYGPYGTQRYQSGPMPTYTTKGFTGQYADSVTGLDYYNARYYDPVAGVFLSADSVQGNMQGMNPYGYVGGNPETRNNPTGLCPFCIAALVVGIVVGAAVVGNIVGTAIQGYATGKPPSASDYGKAALERVVEGLGLVAIGVLTLAAPEAVVGFTVGLAINALFGGVAAGIAVGVIEGIASRFSSGGGSQQCPSNDNCTPMPGCPANYSCTPKPTATPTPTTGSPTIRLPGSHAEKSTPTLPGVSKGMLEAKYMGTLGYRAYDSEASSINFVPWRPEPSLPSSILMERLEALRW